jgi:hypothetical protein
MAVAVEPETVQLSVQGSFWIVDVDDRVPSGFAVKTNFVESWKPLLVVYGHVHCPAKAPGAPASALPPLPPSPLPPLLPLPPSLLPQALTLARARRNQIVLIDVPLGTLSLYPRIANHPRSEM